jgi:hypothetical protein
VDVAHIARRRDPETTGKQLTVRLWTGLGTRWEIQREQHEQDVERSLPQSLESLKDDWDLSQFLHVLVPLSLIYTSLDFVT